MRYSEGEAAVFFAQALNAKSPAANEGDGAQKGDK